MKIKDAIKAIGLLIKHPYLLNAVLQNEIPFKKVVQKKYGIKNGLPVIDYSDIVDNNVHVSPYACLDGGSLPTDLMLLNSLAQSKPDTKYFEIGTWRGESVANVSRYAKECNTLNEPVSRMKANGLPPEIINQLRFFSKDLVNVNHLEGDSASFDYSDYNSSMDLIFVDGDHTYNGVKNDTEKVLPLIKDENSIIVWHDYAVHPDTTRWEVLLGILDGLPKNLHKHLYAVSNTKCAILSKKDWKSTTQKKTTTPNKSFLIKIETQKQ